MAGRLNRRRRSRNASMAASAGWRSNAIAAGPAPAFRSTLFGNRGITPIWKLEAALKSRSCKKGRHAPPVHMIKLTQEREITPYVWVHPDDDR
jgi:hypothetical protein